MDFDSNGTLWIVDLYGALCSVNLNTGAITQVAETGISAPRRPELLQPERLPV